MRHVVRISDGLGNQMFQYAFAYALQRTTNDEVLIDPLFWGTSLRRYQLDNYNITLNDRLVSETTDYLLGFGIRNGRRFKDSFRKYLIRKHYVLIKEKEIMAYDEEALRPKNNSFFEGFWQTYLYFDAYRDDIKKELTRTTPLSSRAIQYINEVKQCNSVSLHIRRTDYVREEGNVALKLKYYEKALDILDKKYDEYKLFIFTDDAEFVRKSFLLKDYTLVEGLSDIDDFEVMKNCKHHITANSTFSWWAAYLADDGEVIAPRVDIWGKDYYPKNWTVIEAEV